MKKKLFTVSAVLILFVFYTGLMAANLIISPDYAPSAGYCSDDDPNAPVPDEPQDANDPNEPNVVVPE